MHDAMHHSSQLYSEMRNSQFDVLFSGSYATSVGSLQNGWKLVKISISAESRPPKRPLHQQKKGNKKIPLKLSITFPSLAKHLYWECSCNKEDPLKLDIKAICVICSNLSRRYFLILSISSHLGAVPYCMPTISGNACSCLVTYRATNHFMLQIKTN